MNEYHEIFMPLPDVYEHAGDQVFDRFSYNEEKGAGKNLVVFPFEFADTLEERVRGMIGPGAEDTLKRVKQMMHSGLDRLKGDDQDVVIAHVNDGLDVAFVEYVDQGGKNARFSITDLVRRLGRMYGEKRPKLITTREKNHMKYAARGIAIEDPDFLRVSADIVNEGLIIGTEDLFAKLYENRGRIPHEQAVELIGRDLFSNQFIRSKKRSDEQYQYARVTGSLERNRDGTRIVGVKDLQVVLLDEDARRMRLRVGDHSLDNLLGISARDMEQFLALQYGLLNTDVELFFLCGSQGSGKTLLAYVGAIDQILRYDAHYHKLRGYPEDTKKGPYEQIILLKPDNVMGGREGIGFLPGDVWDKLEKHLEPYVDAHKESDLGGLLPFKELLLHPKFESKIGPQRKISRIAEGNLPPHREAVTIAYSGFLRGRSFTNSFIIVDEAQNYTPYELKTIIERAGHGCKIVVLGDPLQVDNPDCSREINGLTGAINHYLGEPYMALLNLSVNYRSQMSDRARSWKVYST